MSETFTCDHIYFTHEGKPFLPKINTNVALLRVDCTLTCDLKWEGVKEEAESLIEEGKFLFWDLQFGLEEVSLADEASLSSFLLAIRSFIERFFLPFEKSTFGVSLYRGPLFSSFKWNVDFEESFLSWKEGCPSFPDPKSLYQIEVLSEYLHRLSAALPDEALPFALFEAEEMSTARLAQLVSREHFPYLYVGLNNHTLPFSPFCEETEKARVGVTLPLHANCSEESMTAVDEILKELKQKKVPFRLVAESHLTECWDGLDELVLFSKFLSMQGKRKALGFTAAGGQLVIQGESLQLPEEIMWDEFRGRGI